MDDIGRYIIGIPGMKDLIRLPLLLVNQAAAYDVADLLMGMRVLCPHRPCGELQFDGHQVPAVGQHLAGDASADVAAVYCFVLSKHVFSFLSMGKGHKWLALMSPHRINPDLQRACELRQPEADLRNKRNQNQRDEHAEIEGQCCLDHFLHRPFCHGRTDEQHRADRRREQADAAVEHHHDAELDRVNSHFQRNRKKDRRRDQDDGRHVHDHAKEQNDDVQHQDYNNAVAGDAGDEGGRLGGDVQIGQAVAERTGEGDQDQYNRQGVNALFQALPDALPVESSVDIHRHNQRVDDRDGRRLGGREDAADNADHDDQHREQGPDGLADLLDEVLQGEGCSLGIIALYRDDVGPNHQGDRKQRAGDIAGHEERADRDAAGRSRKNDHVVAGRNQQAFAGGRDRNRGGEVRVIALVHHHRDQDGAQRGCVRRSRARNPAEEVGRHDVHHRKAAAHPADQGVCKGNQFIRDSSRSHQNAHCDEEGHRHQ